MKKRVLLIISLGWVVIGFGSLPLNAEQSMPTGQRPSIQEKEKKWGLTAEQIKKLEEASRKRLEGLKNFEAQQRQVMVQLREQVKANAGDKNIGQTLNDLEKATFGLYQARADFRAATATFLTPTQRAEIIVDAHPSGSDMTSKIEPQAH